MFNVLFSFDLGGWDGWGGRDWRQCLIAYSVIGRWECWNRIISPSTKHCMITERILSLCLETFSYLTQLCINVYNWRLDDCKLWLGTAAKSPTCSLVLTLRWSWLGLWTVRASCGRLRMDSALPPWGRNVLYSLKVKIAACYSLTLIFFLSPFSVYCSRYSWALYGSGHRWDFNISIFIHTLVSLSWKKIRYEGLCWNVLAYFFLRHCRRFLAWKLWKLYLVV